MKIEQIIVAESKPGLWSNIHAKQERIKHGSSEHMRKPGSKGAPTAKNFRDAAKEDVDEGAPIATTPGSIEPGGAVDNFKQQMANNTELDYQAEGKGDYVPPKEADYGDDYQDMVKRVAAQEKRKQEKRKQEQQKTKDLDESTEQLNKILKLSGHTK